MARTIILTAKNDSTKTIVLTRDVDTVTIAFDMVMDSGKDLYFDIPTWAKPETDKYTFTNSIGLLVPSPGSNIYLGMNAMIREYFDLSFSVLLTHRYTGSFKYNAASYEHGTILDGIRLNCIATIEEITRSVMEDIQRNHQGELISSKTFDTANKKTFNITTLPVAGIRYKAGTIYTNTLEEIEGLLYDNNLIGEYRGFHHKNKNYICLLTGDKRATQRYINVEGGFYVAEVFSFTLEEV